MNENLFLPFPFSSSQVQKYKYFNNTYTHIYIYRMQMLRTMQRPNLALSQRTLQCTNRTQQQHHDLLPPPPWRRISARTFQQVKGPSAFAAVLARRSFCCKVFFVVAASCLAALASALADFASLCSACGTSRSSWFLRFFGWPSALFLRCETLLSGTLPAMTGCAPALCRPHIRMRHCTHTEIS